MRHLLYILLFLPLFLAAQSNQPYFAARAQTSDAPGDLGGDLYRLTLTITDETAVYDGLDILDDSTFVYICPSTIPGEDINLYPVINIVLAFAGQVTVDVRDIATAGPPQVGSNVICEESEQGLFAYVSGAGDPLNQAISDYNMKRINIEFPAGGGTTNRIWAVASAPDTTTITSPIEGDIAYVDSTLMFLRDSAAWLLFSGGTPLPDSIVYQSELETTIDTLISGSGTTGYLALWNAARRLGDGPARVRGDSLVELEIPIMLPTIASQSAENVTGELFYSSDNAVMKGYSSGKYNDLYPRPEATLNQNGNVKLWDGEKWQDSNFSVGVNGANATASYSKFRLSSATDLEWVANIVGIYYDNSDLKFYVNTRQDFSWHHNEIGGARQMYLDCEFTPGPRLAIGSHDPSYSLDISAGAGTAIKLLPTTAPTNAEGVIYANDSDDRLRYLDGVSNNILAYKSELSTFGGYADTVAVLKETTSQSLAATASYLRITGLETTGLAEVITTTDSTLIVPVDGNYRIRYNCSIQIAAAGAGTWRFNTLAYNNAANIPETQSSIQVVTAGAETWIQPVSGEAITTLTAGDEISLRYTATSGPTYTLYPGTITVEKL